jgi:hypothetical protein
MNRSRRRQTEPGSDYDSFLDIVANLVGILIILIMVIGVRAQNAYESCLQSDLDKTAASTRSEAAIPEEPAAIASLELPESELVLPDVETPKQEVIKLHADALRLDEEVNKIEYESEIQLARRDRLQVLVTSVQRKLGEHRERLADDERQRVDKQLTIAERRRQLNRLNDSIRSISTARPPPEILEHYPTPLAKTVFGQEEHFRLLAGRLARVPINDITNKLGNDARSNVWKLNDTSRVTETFGPLEGFLIKYTLVARNRRVPTENGYVMRRGVELERFVLIPTTGLREVSLDGALAPNSEFRRRLAQIDPQETTVTVWTYPDSYAELRKLKDELFKLGFLTATRPLPEGYPIGGSPRGTKSAAQ